MGINVFPIIRLLLDFMGNHRMGNDAPPSRIAMAIARTLRHVLIILRLVVLLVTLHTFGTVKERMDTFAETDAITIIVTEVLDVLLTFNQT